MGTHPHPAGSIPLHNAAPHHGLGEGPARGGGGPANRASWQAKTDAAWLLRWSSVLWTDETLLPARAPACSCRRPPQNCQGRSAPFGDAEIAPGTSPRLTLPCFRPRGQPLSTAPLVSASRLVHGPGRDGLSSVCTQQHTEVSSAAVRRTGCRNGRLGPCGTRSFALRRPVMYARGQWRSGQGSDLHLVRHVRAMPPGIRLRLGQ